MQTDNYTDKKNKKIINVLIYMSLLSHGAECNMGNIFRVSHILQLISKLEIIAKYEKREKDLPILLEVTCDNYLLLNDCWKIFANIAQGNVE